MVLHVFRYFKRKRNSENLPKNRGHRGKYTPEQKAIIGNSTAEHGVVVHPRPLYIGGNLVPQLSLSKLEPIALCVHDGCGLYLTRPQFFYHESLQIQASTKILPPPGKIPAIL